MFVLFGMRIPAFYHPTVGEGTVTLSPSESHHLARVLRLGAGARVRLLDGRGMVCEGAVVTPRPSGSIIRITGCRHVPPPLPRIALYVPPPQTTDRLHWLVEKSTELGCRTLHFIITRRTIRHKIKPDRLEKTAIAALKQSHNPFLPEMKGPTPLHRLSLTAPAFYGAPTGQRWQDAAPSAGEALSFWIGPEGGFVPEEIEWLTENGAIAVRLGPYTLRTETAAMAAVAMARAFYA